MAVHFKVGERVRFLHEKQDGIVQQILGPNRLEVLVEDFLEIEVSTSEVVKIHAAESILTEEEDEDGFAPPKPENIQVINASASFVVLKNADKNYEFWILNPSSDELMFACYYKVRQKFKGLGAGSVAPKDQVFLGKLSAQDFHPANSVHVQLLRYPHAGQVRPRPEFSMEIRCKSKIFNKNPEVIHSLGGRGYEFLLEEQLEPELPESEFATISRAKPVPEKQIGDIVAEVIDLHIAKLVQDPTRMDTRNMIFVQMEEVERAIAQARLKGALQLVFIHGIGTGRLKRQVHEKLKEYDFVKSFNLADPLKYGNGATIVFFKEN